MRTALKKITIIEHLQELRTRIIKTAAVFIFACVIAFLKVDVIVKFITKDFGKFIFTHPSELFLTYIKVSVYTGFFISLPFIIYQLWSFLFDAIEPSKKRYIFYFTILSLLLALIGMLFGSIIVFPILTKFFTSFATDKIIPLFSIENFVTFFLTTTLLFIIVFQLPIFFIFFEKIGLINIFLLEKNRKYAILVAFIVGAILTPPDVVSQILLAVPLIFLYELTIIFSKIFSKKPAG